MYRVDFGKRCETFFVILLVQFGHEFKSLHAWVRLLQLPIKRVE